MPTSHRPTAWFLSALIIGTVAVDPFGFAPFGPIKWVIVTTAGFGALWMAVAAKLQVHRPSLWGWLAFLTWGVLVSVLALDPVHTWIGTPDRRLGLVTVAGFMAAYLAAQSLRSRGITTLGRSLVIGIWIMVATAGLEVAGVFSGPFDFPGSRLGGPFGTPAYLGAALVLFVPIVFAVGPSLRRSSLADGRPFRRHRRSRGVARHPDEGGTGRRGCSRSYHLSGVGQMGQGQPHAPRRTSGDLRRRALVYQSR